MVLKLCISSARYINNRRLNFEKHRSRFEDQEIDYGHVKEVVNLCGLASYIEGLRDGLNTEIVENGARLSGGQRPENRLARALYKECRILLFDEPTSSLDVETERLFIEALFKIIRKKYDLDNGDPSHGILNTATEYSNYRAEGCMCHLPYEFLDLEKEGAC